MDLVGREGLEHAAERHLSVQLSRARQGHRKPPLESRYGRLRSSQPADALTTPAHNASPRGQQRAVFFRSRRRTRGYRRDRVDFMKLPSSQGVPRRDFLSQAPSYLHLAQICRGDGVVTDPSTE